MVVSDGSKKLVLGVSICSVSRIILGPLKHVLHLVWNAYVISTAIRTALKVARGSESVPLALVLLALVLLALVLLVLELRCY